ncbi:MAG: hypothetical protein ABI567_08325 [Gammaproteobacteria bacterium]
MPVNGRRLRAAGLVLVVLGLAPGSCAAPPRGPALSCMQQTVDSLPLAGLSNDRQHCLASGTIQRRCGRLSAWAAGYGKEVADLFGPGNFQQRDLKANAAGRACATAPGDEGALANCCAGAGF